MSVKKNEKSGKMTIDKLAIMVARGFENTATKDDIKNMATKDDIKNMATKDDLKDLETRMNGKFEGVNRRIDDMSMNRVKYEDYDKLKSRMNLIEKKVGL